MKTGMALTKAQAGFQNLFDIPFGGHFGANRQVADDNIGFGVFEDFDNVSGWAGGFGREFRKGICPDRRGSCRDRREHSGWAHQRI